MKKRLLSFILFIMAGYCSAQDGLNLLVLKKKERTTKTFMTGSVIQFTNRNGREMEGLVTKITRDSFYLRSFYIQKTGNEKGFIFFDTIYTADIPVPLPDVYSVYIPKKNFRYKASEYTAYLAAAWFTVMGAVNGAKFDQKGGDVLKEIAVRGGGFFLLGRLFRWLGREDFKLGRKYRLVTVL